MKKCDDPWRLPELQRLGTQFRELETDESRAPASRRYRIARRLAPVAVGVALAGATLELVAPAGARLRVNQAPVAAERSGSVAFSSVLEAEVHGTSIGQLNEQGELDFSTGNYATVLTNDRAGVSSARRRIGPIVYFSGQRKGAGAPSGRRWLASPASNQSVTQLGASIVDPQVVFDVLERAPSHVAPVGHALLDGHATTQYRLRTTLGSFLEGEGARPSEIRVYRGVSGTLEVWLDSQGRPRRVEALFEGHSHFSRARLHVTIAFFGYGSKVQVRAPMNWTPAHASQRTSGLEAGVRVLERLLFASP